MTLTTMQYALMNLIAHNEMNTTNGATPTQASDVNCWLWADEFAKDLGLTGKQVGGLLTTLTEAGLIGVQKAKKVRGQADESSVWFTEQGFEAWQASHLAEQRIADLEKQTTTPKKTTKTVVATKKEQTMTNNVIDLLAAREGSFKRLVAQALLSAKGKAMTLSELAAATYGKTSSEANGHVGMVLKGIDKAIKTNGLALVLIREKGVVTLSSLEPKPVKKPRASKKRSIASFLPNNSEESINIRSKRSRKAA